MKFEYCYELVKAKFMEVDLSAIDSDFSGMAQIKDEEDQLHYIYASYVGGQKFIEPVQHDSATLSLTLTQDTLEKILTKEIDAFKAFSTGKVKAKGNIFLAISLYKKYKSAKLGRA